MHEHLRKTGISITGDIPWGTHFCQLYRSKEDLAEMLVPYFRAGLENNEYCLWVTAEPLDEESAREALGAAMPGLDLYLEKGQLEIIPHNKWFASSGTSDMQKAVQGWIRKLRHALEQGYEGLRTSADTAGLQNGDWKSVTAYEEEMNGVIAGSRAIALCTHNLDRCSASDIIDLINHHQFTLSRHQSQWRVVESAERRADEALRMSEEQYRSLVENLHEGIWMIDKDARTTFVNPRMAEVLGYSLDEMLGRHLFSFMEEREQEMTAHNLARRMKGMKEQHYCKFLRKDGASVYTSLETSPLTDKNGTYTGAIAAVQDITERYLAEKALRESESRFRGIFDGSSVGIAMCDIEGRVMEANNAVFQFLGYSREELIGMNFAEFTHPDDLPRDAKLYGSLITGEQDGYVIDHRCVTKNGDAFWGRLSVSAIKDEHGKLLYTVMVCEDITERKQAEEALRQSETRLMEAHQMAKMGRWDFIHGENRLQWTETVYDIFEVNHDTFSVSYEAFIAAVHPDDRQIVNQAWAASLVTQATYEIEHRLLMEDGRVKWLFERCRTEFDEQGQPAISVGIVQDITQRKQAEEALRQSEEYNRSIINIIPDIIIRTNKKGEYLDIPSSSQENLARPRQELLGKRISDILTRETAVALLECIEEALDTKSLQIVEYGLEVPAGNLSFEARILPSTEDEVICLIRDITERKQAESLIKIRLVLLEYAAAHSMQELLQKALDEVEAATNSTIGFYHFVHSDQNNLSLQAWSTLTLAKFCQAEGRGMHYPIDRAGVWVDCVRTKRPVVHNDFAALPHRRGTPEGHAAIVRELVVPIIRGGRIVAILGVGNKPSDYTEQDVELVSYLADVAWEITQRKQAEDKLHIAYEDEKGLRRSLEREEQKRLEFSRALVHELKTPLTAVIATSDLFISELKDEPWASMAANIHRGAQGLSKRIDELLDLAKGEIGMLKVNLKPVSPLELLGEIMSEMIPFAAARDQSLIADLPESLPELNADDVRLRQVIYNLINNACKFTKAGGKVTIRARQEDSNLVVEVQDTGVGLTQAEQERLFRPYERLDADRQRFSGLGLGLALSKNLVELHGGRIWVNSKKGQGSTFGFSIPIDGHGDKPGEDNGHGPLGP